MQIQSHKSFLKPCTSFQIVLGKQTKINPQYGLSDSVAYLFLVAQLVKNPPAMRETWVQSLGWEDPMKKGMATHSSVLAWRIP